MPDENDQHDNVTEEKKRKNGKAKNGGLHQLRPLDELKAGQKAKVKEPRPPAELPNTWPAPELAALASRVIRSGRLHMGALHNVKIAFAWTNAEREGDFHNVAKTQRFSRTYAFLYNDRGESVPDFIMRVAKHQWDRIPEDLQEQAMYHYLLHFGTDTRGRPRIEAPDIVAFGAELEEFKGERRWNEHLVRARNLGLWDGIANVETLDEERRRQIAVPTHN